MEFKKIRKRDYRIVPFDKKKITNAIYKAARSVGGHDFETAQSLTDEVVKELAKKCKNVEIPSVEQIQDCIERVLIEDGHTRTAKAFILYRQERTEVREEKKLVLEKDNIDEVDKAFDLNALRVLKSRYLRKDEEGKLIETPKELFTRVAIHAALPEILYDKLVFDKAGKQKKWKEENYDEILRHGDYKIGKYKLNKHHLEALVRMHKRFNEQKQMKTSFAKIMQMLRIGEFQKHEKTIDCFYELMTTKKFLPNTPAIANFGSYLGMGSACFVLDVPDSIDGIMEALKKTAIVFKSGGGMGYNFSKIRPEGDFVSTTSGIASGPISFMTLFDKMTDVIKQGGIRRGANMGILNSNHPDIEEFITAKEGNKALRNFNISVLIMPEFWEAYKKKGQYPLVNPRNGSVVKNVNAMELFEKIALQAWASAEPGVIFFDKINETNPFYESLGPIVTTNPCSEVLLYPNESCNLGSLNVWNFVKEDEKGNAIDVDWKELEKTILVATKFLDNVIDVNNYPLKDIEEMTLNTRKIGLGIMGLADLLYDLKLPYNSEAGRRFMEKLMEFVNYYTKLESIELAKERGKMPYYGKSFYGKGKLPFKGFEDKKNSNFDWEKIAKEIKKHGIRNGYTTVIAPTGSISMIAGCSSGIEPVYALVFQKNVNIGSFYYVDPVFEKVLKLDGLYDAKLVEKIIENRGSLQGVENVTQEMRNVFVTAYDITVADHIRALAAFQKWTDSSISKTNNLPANASVDDVKESYLLAYDLGCKDISVFRDSSIKDQVLVSGKKEKEINPEIKVFSRKKTTGAEDYKLKFSKSFEKKESIFNFGKDNFGTEIKNCYECGNKLVLQEGCSSCIGCGWGMCK